MKIRILAAILVTGLMIFAGYAALFIAPDERTMHEIQRIFYFHVPSWSACFTAFFVAFLANIAYLATRRNVVLRLDLLRRVSGFDWAWFGALGALLRGQVERAQKAGDQENSGQRWDALGVSAAEVGVVACTLGLITGPLWAKPVWGVWWTWDARLTTTFILWLLYISYLLLRGLIEEPERRATLSAVFGIFAFLDVPLVYMSNRLWRTQHPAPVIFGGEGSGLDPTMGKVLGLCIVAVLCLMVLLLVDRYRLEKLRREVDEVRQEVESRSLDAGAVSVERRG